MEQLDSTVELVEEDHPVTPRTPMTGMSVRLTSLLLLVMFLMGLGSGYLLTGLVPLGNAGNKAASTASKQSALMDQINPPKGYTVPATFGNLGPTLIASGAIDYDRFVQLYKELGRPLTEEQINILTKGGATPVVINRENAHFLLNFFWAVGLANKNKVLEEGPMQTYSQGKIEGYASTGGWTLGSKSPVDLYARVPLITLTAEQQALVEQVADGVFRPCCNNPTRFPDCNHGMAMLGLLELMASQGASADQMFAAAKYVNAFWFPQQTLELAKFFQVQQGKNFDQADARQIVGNSFSSGSGSQMVHKWLADNGQLEQTPGGGGSCGVG